MVSFNYQVLSLGLGYLGGVKSLQKVRLPDFQCDADSGLEPTLASKSEILSRGCAKMSDASLHGKVLATKPYTLNPIP